MTKTQYDSILVIIKKLTKYIVLVLYRKLNTTKQFAYAFFKKVISRYNLLKKNTLGQKQTFYF